MAPECKEVKERVAQIKAEINQFHSPTTIEKNSKSVLLNSSAASLSSMWAQRLKRSSKRKKRASKMLCMQLAQLLRKGSFLAAALRCFALSKASINSNSTAMKQIGAEIIRQAAFAPATAIANNCGKQGNLIAEKIFEKEGAFGYNGLTDEFADLVKAGVIDPVLVTKSAFINAASVSGLLVHHCCHDHR